MKKIVAVLIVLVLVGAVGWRVYQKVAERRAGATPRQARRPAVAVVHRPVRHEDIRDVREFT